MSSTTDIVTTTDAEHVQGDVINQEDVDRQLAYNEGVIERGLATFIDVGNALTAIRDGNLYPTTHPTFEAYCADRWGLVRSRAYQMIDAAEVSTIVDAEELPAPPNESVARELAKLKKDPKKVVRAWKATVKAHGAHPTAEQARAAVDKVLSKPKAKPATEGPKDGADEVTGRQESRSGSRSAKWEAVSELRSSGALAELMAGVKHPNAEHPTADQIKAAVDKLTYGFTERRAEDGLLDADDHLSDVERLVINFDYVELVRSRDKLINAVDILRDAGHGELASEFDEASDYVDEGCKKVRQAHDKLLSIIPEERQAVLVKCGLMVAPELMPDASRPVGDAAS